MTHRVGFDPVAEAELADIYDYVRTQSGSPDIAERFVRRIVDQCMRLAEFPERGSRHDEVRPGLRSIGFQHRVTIAFVVDDTAVTILRIFYGGRDTSGVLGR